MLKISQVHMTAATFANWINSELLPNSHLSPGFPWYVAPRTTRNGYMILGFHLD